MLGVNRVYRMVLEASSSSQISSHVLGCLLNSSTVIMGRSLNVAIIGTCGRWNLNDILLPSQSLANKITDSSLISLPTRIKLFTGTDNITVRFSLLIRYIYLGLLRKIRVSPTFTRHPALIKYH